MMLSHTSLNMKSALLLLLALFFTGVEAKKDVREVRTRDEFDRIINHHALTGMPVVVDYYSDSCGPCRQIAPRYQALAKEYKDKAVFLKVNVQTAPSVASNVRSMPTFRFFMNGKQKHEFSGGDEGQLRQYTQKYTNQFRKNPKPILEIKDKKQWKKLMTDAASLPVAVAFVAKKHDDCRDMYQVFKDLNKKNQGKMLFTKVYAQENEALAEECKVATGDVPVVQIYASRKKVDEVFGVNEAALREKVAAAIKARETRAPKKEKKGGADKEQPCAEAKAPEPKRPQTRSPLRLVMGQLRAEKVVIIGAGPAGLSAAIYAARAGLKPVLIAPDMGGQLMTTKEVENYPALVDGTGPALVDLMRVQAESFDTQFEATTVMSVDLSKQPFTLTTNQTKNNIITTHTLIIATGADARWLGVPGEATYRAKGISSCATCDGFLFKDKKVIVVGGGDTAMEEALFLARICSEVTVVHRRDTFRASYILQQRVLNHKKIKIVWNHQVKEFKGDAEKVTHAVLEHVETKETTDHELDAVFVAIGHTPNTELFKEDINMDAHGYILTKDKSTTTSVEGVFAAGDVADSVYRQAVTSAGSGAMASLDAERWLNEHGAVEEEDEGDLFADVDLTKWTVKMLKAVMKDQGISMKGCIEKPDFIKRIQAHSNTKTTESES